VHKCLIVAQELWFKSDPHLGRNHLQKLLPDWDRRSETEIGSVALPGLPRKKEA
jgi:hypothetical protein